MKSNTLFRDARNITMRTEDILLTEVSVVICWNQKKVAWIIRKDIVVSDENSIDLPFDAICENCESRDFTAWCEQCCVNPVVSWCPIEVINSDWPNICPEWKRWNLDYFR
ncbi:MAG: hypothetical protein ACD_78C00065G0009 [uncultured bacterium (gcode 4)]|uniref:Uncharacterized protein n=1 Tax=uncultured bacterium (gcode 4) TaxID=1234023 RepID=K1YYB3_9BACT|nr:MAG: hypothetical protein ACD_78C00065G0009 [uncultured bacterium (gcode 4)]